MGNHTESVAQVRGEYKERNWGVEFGAGVGIVSRTVYSGHEVSVGEAENRYKEIGRYVKFGPPEQEIIPPTITPRRQSHHSTLPLQLRDRLDRRPDPSTPIHKLPRESSGQEERVLAVESDLRQEVLNTGAQVIQNAQPVAILAPESDK